MGGRGSGRKPDLYKRDANELLDLRTQKVVPLLTHPRLDTIPDPEFPLSRDALLKYRELAEMLFKAGQLTVITKGFVESAAVAFGEIHARQTDGRSVSADLLKRYQSALGNIQQFDIDRSVVGATEQPKNRFRHTGFAQRMR